MRAFVVLGVLVSGFVAGGQVAVAAPPAAPALVSPANAASVTVPFTISWSQVLDPAAVNGGYNWAVSTTSTFATSVITDATFASVTQATVSGLANGTYFWRVNAVNAALETSAWSATRSFTVTGAGAGQLAAPTLNSPHGGTTQFHPWEAIRFSWSAVAGAATYTTEFSTDSSFPVDSVNYYRVTNISGTSDGTLHDDSMQQGTWFVRVRAVGADLVAGAVSNVISFSVLYGNPVGPPPALISPIGNPTLTLPITLRWADGYNPQSSGYEVQLSTSSSFSTVLDPLPGLTNPSLFCPDLPSGPLFWRVRSHQGDSSPTTSAVTAWSATGTFTISTAPAVPASVTSTRSPLIYSGAGHWAGVQLSARAPAGGAVVSLTSSDPAALPMPATIAVEGGRAQGGSNELWAGQVTVPTAVTVTATYNGSSVSTVFTVMPPTLRTDTLQSVVRFTGGTGPGVGSISLVGGGLAPPGGVTVNIASSSPAATPPATATIAAGFNAGGFAIPTSAVTVDTPVTITASYQGVSAEWTITLTPQQAPATIILDRTFTTGNEGASGTVSRSLVPDGQDVHFALSSSNPAVASVAPYVTVGGWAAAGGFSIQTTNPAVQTDVVISATGAGVTRSVTLTVAPIGAPAQPALSSIGVSPASVVAGSASTATVILTAAAPAGGIVVGLASSVPAAASVPATVTVPAGATSATATVTTFPAAATTVQVSATFGAVTQSASLGITAPPTPTALTISPTTVVGGNSSTGTVTLSVAAPAGGAVVTLVDDSAVATVPGSVTVAAGASSTTFTVTTAVVSVQTLVVVSGSVGGVTRSATLTVNPPTPVAPILSAPANGATGLSQPVTLDWNDVPNATTYEVRVDDSSSISSPFVANPTVSVSQSVHSGLPVRQLWWRVRARNAAGVFGPFSSTRSFTPLAAATTPTLSTVAVSPASLVGGASATGTVMLTAAAPAGGALVALSSGNAAAAVPTTVTVAAGATSVSFPVTTVAVTAQITVTLTATWSGVSRTAALTVNPPASLASVAVSPTSVTGGSSSTGTVTLTSAAPAGGVVVSLASSNVAVSVPASVTVAAGATSVAFTAGTTIVSVQVAVTITATAGLVNRTATLTVNPAASGALPAPSLVSPANDARFDAGQTITFDWGDVAGAASYTIQIDDQDTFASPTVNQSVTASTFATSTLPTTRMWWRARAVDGAGNPGAWSAARRFELR